MEKEEVPFSSNVIRLSLKEWGVALISIIALFVFTPTLWEHVEPFAPEPDYRIPYKWSSDYWHYARYARRAASANKTLIIGDSVVWGQYVKPDETLSHCLNALTKTERFANLGTDGMHPVALAGLLRYYGGAVSGKNVVLHCNPLWMTSAKHDLQTDKEFRFNHPKLVPQFFPRISCYAESASGRLGVVVERSVDFFTWADHLRIAYFDSMDIPAWTLEHPYASILTAAFIPPELGDKALKRGFQPWTERGIGKQDFPWVDPKTSLQWRFFRKAVELLQSRHNKVFVLVGPFNEHMLTEGSLAAYRKIKGHIAAWLRQNRIPHYLPPVLPSEQYADASHPLAKGYETLAKWLTQDVDFQNSVWNK